MDLTHRPGGPLEGLDDKGYIRKLLVERFYIYAKLFNPGGSIILRASDIVDHDRPTGYSTEIGNNYHLDLIELEQGFNKLMKEGTLTRKEAQAILAWSQDLSPQQAAEYIHSKGNVSLRQMRSRGMAKLHQRLSNGEGKDAGRTGDGDATGGRQGAGNDPVPIGDNRPEASEGNQ